MRQNSSGQPHPLIQVEADLMELVPDHPLFWHRQIDVLHQLLDKEPIPFERGYPPGRRVRLRDIAQRFELAQVIAHGRRADPQPANPSQRARTDSRRRGGVHVHQDLEDLSLATRQLLFRLALSPVGCCHINIPSGRSRLRLISLAVNLASSQRFRVPRC